MKNLTNPTTCSHEAPTFKPRGRVKTKSEFEFSFQSLFLVDLLVSTLAVIVSPISITNGRVSYKYIKVLCLFGGV